MYMPWCIDRRRLDRKIIGGVREINMRKPPSGIGASRMVVGESMYRSFGEENEMAVE